MNKKAPKDKQYPLSKTDKEPEVVFLARKRFKNAPKLSSKPSTRLK